MGGLGFKGLGVEGFRVLGLGAASHSTPGSPQNLGPQQHIENEHNTFRLAGIRQAAQQKQGCHVPFSFGFRVLVLWSSSAFITDAGGYGLAVNPN